MYHRLRSVDSGLLFTRGVTLGWLGQLWGFAGFVSQLSGFAEGVTINYWHD